MKISGCNFMLTLTLWHVGCDGATVSVQKQQEGSFSDVVAPYEEKLYIPDESESYVEGEAFADGHREMTECGQNQRVFFVTFTTDNRAEETSFQLIGPSGGIIGRAPVNGQRFQDRTQYTFRYCVRIGYQYKLRWQDTGGNGMCCQFGQGTYRYGIDGTKMYGSNMQKTFSNVGVHTFKVPSRSSSQSNSGNSGGSGGNGSSNNSGNTGSNQSSSNSGGSGSNQSAIGKEDDFGVERDDAWLEAHNVRRKKYHVQWGKSYVPLKWSPMLANEARQWANQLLDGCGSPFSTANHEPGVSEGENMARNIGSGDNGELKTPDQILNRWVEMEFNDGYPENAHLTQALWRASKYVGCADSVKAIGGGYCRYQVCRYATAGNCNMGYWNAKEGNKWMTPMLNDESKCGPDCTPEGWC